MTKTELKVKLAEQCLPASKELGRMVKDDKGNVQFVHEYDYNLAEKIINFLDACGVKLEE